MTIHCKVKGDWLYCEVLDFNGRQVYECYTIIGLEDTYDIHRRTDRGIGEIEVSEISN